MCILIYCTAWKVSIPNKLFYVLLYICLYKLPPSAGLFQAHPNTVEFLIGNTLLSNFITECSIVHIVSNVLKQN